MTQVCTSLCPTIEQLNSRKFTHQLQSHMFSHPVCCHALALSHTCFMSAPASPVAQPHPCHIAMADSLAALFDAGAKCDKVSAFCNRSRRCLAERLASEAACPSDVLKLRRSRAKAVNPASPQPPLWPSCHAVPTRTCPQCRFALYAQQWTNTYGSHLVSISGRRIRVVWLAERPPKFLGSWA